MRLPSRIRLLPYSRSFSPSVSLRLPLAVVTLFLDCSLSDCFFNARIDTNSVSILFGGQTMAWLEQAALISARNVARGLPNVHWKTVAMDGLEFKRPVVVVSALLALLENLDADTPSLPSLPWTGRVSHSLYHSDLLRYFAHSSPPFSPTES